MGNRKTETESDRGAGRRRSKTREKKRNQKKGRRNYDYHPRGNGVYKLGCNVYGSNPQGGG